MHNHKGQSGPPYDPSAPLTCPECCEELIAKREALCKKYGWQTWPQDCSAVTLDPRR